jgi:hypothetical protein
MKDVEMSKKFALRFPIDARFYNLIPYPNTELYDIVDKNNYFIRRPEDYLNDVSRFGEDAPYETPELSAKQKDKIIKDVYNIKKKIRIDTYRKEYGFLGWIWAHLTFLILPVMTFIWNLSPNLYDSLKKMYFIFRDSLTRRYVRKSRGKD